MQKKRLAPKEMRVFQMKQTFLYSVFGSCISALLGFFFLSLSPSPCLLNCPHNQKLLTIELAGWQQRIYSDNELELLVTTK